MGCVFVTMKHGCHHKQGIAPQHVEQSKGFIGVTPETSQAKSQAQGNIGERVPLKNIDRRKTAQ